jgi:lipoate-protein ligase A
VQRQTSKIVAAESPDNVAAMLFAELTEVLDPEPHPAALNMAIDEALLHTADTPLLRIYRWARPAISFGYFEKFADLEMSGREAIRRWTGGGVVLHGDDLTYTLIVPASHPFARLPARVLYRQIHERLALVLREGGVDTSLAPESSPKISSGCFENAAEADVLAGDRKIAGAAQRRTRLGLLHQGSIQAGRGMTISLAAAFTAKATTRALDDAEIQLAARLAAEKYGTEAWLRKY